MKSLSNDTEPGPELSATRSQQSASQWAATEEGRLAFETQFSFEEQEAFELDDAGEPRDYIVCSHLPSRAWMTTKMERLARSIKSEEGAYKETDGSSSKAPNPRFPIMFSIRAEYYAYLVHAVAANPPSPGSQAHAYGEADRVRQQGYDSALTDNWEALERFCFDVRKLRDQCPPAREDAWAAILNRFFTMAVEKWMPLLNTPNGQPPAQAMPHTFSRAGKGVQHDPVGHPRSFMPGGGVYIHRIVKGYKDLSRRQKRCLVTQKKVKPRGPAATLPVNIGEWKASRANFVQNDGQIMYSAVQGAGIFQNCQLSERVLLLSVGFGWARPSASSWPGKNSTYDVHLVNGHDLDLGTLKGAISCFLMLYDNAENHVLSATGITRKQLNLTTDLSTLDKIPLKPGPLVDWRSKYKPSPARSARSDLSSVILTEGEGEGQGSGQGQGQGESRRCEVDVAVEAEAGLEGSMEVNNDHESSDGDDGDSQYDHSSDEP
ncbi:hypothetical protein GGX14DRAFT_665206 [Mycena pura]|uniref:Uncharacterized protein n=1 Tax=Mycena pura TaxID=153505 RepID=A0AAD6V280_9AGAR|nr:hypothetical protein GGX14DRAFT_665206 [Mycena pura]